MLDGLLKVLGDLGNPVPRFTAQRCLTVRQNVGGCDACARACPHDAVILTHTVEINEANCTGCGLCVQACPSGALEFDVTGVLTGIRDQDGDAKLVCSKAGEPGRTLPCLARITPSAIVAAGAWDKPLTLVHGDCATCDLGGPTVPESTQAVIDAAQQLRASTGRAAQVTLRPAQAGETSGERVSRRGMFGTLFRGARTVVAQSIPDQPLPFVDWSVPEERVPQDWVWRARALKPTPAPGTPVHWPAPVVDDTCIDCPVCANVCPTNAITRDFQPTGEVTLTLDLAACTSCNACAQSCPPQAITLQPEWPIEAFGEGQVIRVGGSPL
ncbi:4Fe-4S binding protein [Deinococcus maricopensis]|uniref:4Fe-4S ferredoxin iron-sulfur binding domain-containing protein n=1 Tax=Deinococcus maricopensis (strain DSM 21211 / LMG 22137 / NRRL B-23946 / LB-34) TaxID=709986 RepID=E8UAG7_DEIML|nr:4Fe-4S binding protein [Deinococcus maricopensis]ADV68056.1 4Fe-4S ferredoxin iron-sulfur binding domain-containing protein [Deinococcus maricopensis DSM 21211]